MREEREQYFEQCRFVNAWKEHLGYVSVLAFLDPARHTWQYSFRQAVMLELLSFRLRKSGFPDIRFFMISPFGGSPTKHERSDENVEIEAWREIEARGEMDDFMTVNFFKNDRSEITILWDNPRSRLWERFRASKDQVIIIDRCGKLTYHVIVPWSILFFPYVKAAILSTYKEDPCGGCNPTSYRTSGDDEYDLTLTKAVYEKETSSMQNSPDIDTDTTSTTDSLDEPKAGNTSTAAASPLQATNDPTIPAESFTESTTYRPQDGQDRESSTSSEESTVHDQTVTIFYSQTEVHPLANNLPTLVNYESNTTLSVNNPTADKSESDPISAEYETTTSSFANKVRDENATAEDAERFEEDAFLPLRVIMHAPHVHVNSDFDERLEFKIVSPSDSRQVNADSSRLVSSGEYDWETTEANSNEKNAKQKYMFNEDENPGLYGEVAEYSKSSYEDITDRNKMINDAYNNSTTDYDEEHYANDRLVNISNSDESYVIANVTEDPNIEGFTDSRNITVSNVDSLKTINTNNQVDTEEEMRDKLIEHYKKLLPWVDYRLNK
ncbi:hypothetical protein PUN28_010510 [Cardiocondyla obscurior]